MDYEDQQLRLKQTKRLMELSPVKSIGYNEATEESMLEDTIRNTDHKDCISVI
jgi:hypothetical protein